MYLPDNAGVACKRKKLGQGAKHDRTQKAYCRSNFLNANWKECWEFGVWGLNGTVSEKADMQIHLYAHLQDQSIA